MDRELKLHLTKKLVNFIVRVLDRLTPSVKAYYPQTRMVEGVFAKLYKAYSTEVYAGRFDSVAYQTLKGLKDKNFLRFLRLTEKLLVYLGEEDRYYRQWLGLAFVLVNDEVKKTLSSLSFEDFLSLTKQQWLLDYRGAVSSEYFNSHREEFLNIVLTDFLVNLV
jgi:hypothetical protein